MDLAVLDRRRTPRPVTLVTGPVAPQRSRATHPVSPSGAGFALAAHGELLLADGGEPMVLPAGHGADVAHAVERALRTAAPGAVVCGLVPFDPRETARLTLTDDVRRVPWNPGAGTATGSVPVVADVPEVPDDPAYRRAVEIALTRIARGDLDKVVLARTLDHPLPVGFDVDAYLARLAAGNPHGWTFAVRTAAGLLTGASPELVAGLDEEGFRSHPLAGSRPRDPGSDVPPPDLLDSVKDLREHGFVVDHIARELAGATTAMDVPATPSPFATDSMWHLGTAITGTLRPGIGSLQAALAVHPTPAVAGSPSAAALDLVRTLEPSGRGDYAGLVGWTDVTGRGEWALVLRCALLRDPDPTGHRSARLSAGAGVVAGSTAAAEHAETAAKFATVLRALTAVTPSGEDRTS